CSCSVLVPQLVPEVIALSGDAALLKITEMLALSATPVPVGALLVTISATSLVNPLELVKGLASATPARSLAAVVTRNLKVCEGASAAAGCSVKVRLPLLAVGVADSIGTQALPAVTSRSCSELAPQEPLVIAVSVEGLAALLKVKATAVLRATAL